MEQRKLYIIGMDAAPLWIIRDFYKEYRMDGFAELLSKGVLTEMESTMPPMTGPSWPSIYTGFRPGAHGVPEFFKMEPNYTKSVVYYDTSIKAPFWTKLSRRGFRSLIVTPAMLVKQESDPNVDMMTGFPLPARFSSNRLKEVAEKYSFAGEPEVERGLKSGELTLEEASHGYLKGTKARSEVSKELIEKNDYDLAFICFTEQDRMQHYALNKARWKDYILPMYKEVADFIEWVERRAKKEGATVMLVSDHGAQPIKRKFLMNGWLINKGYAQPKKLIEEGIKQVGSGKSSIKYDLRETLLKSGLRKRVYDKLPSSGKKLVKTAIEKTLSGTSSGDYTRLHDFDYDMGKTRAFASIANCPMTTIFVNDDRFDDGIVSADEKKALKKELMSNLLGIKDANGDKLIVNVYDADDYYEGTKLFIAPDIMAEIKPGYIIDAFGYLKSGGLFMDPEPPKSGDHLRNGIFGAISYGKGLDYAGIKKKKLYVYNVEPTVMRYFGLKPDNDRRYGPIF
jgi:predicted AlkP superfamily phosphohydrolase/phosphomutase